MACLTYADDILLLSESEAGLIHQLNLVGNVCTENALTIDFDKTKVMIFDKLHTK